MLDIRDQEETVSILKEFMMSRKIQIWGTGMQKQQVKKHLLLTGKSVLGVQNEAGQRLIEFCQENTLVIANPLFQQHKRRLHMDITRWSTPKSD